MLEAKAKDQGHKRKCSPKKKKRSSQKFFKRSPQKNVFQKIFQALHKILTIQEIVLSSSREQANFRGLEAKDFKMCVFEAKDFLEDSTSGNYCTPFKGGESSSQLRWFIIDKIELQLLILFVLILRQQLQRYLTNTKRYHPKKVFGNSEFCSSRLNHSSLNY